jgi:hypothetical protein
MMALTVISGSTDTRLTTLEAVKLELGIDGSTKDELLTNLIDQASDAIRRITGRTFTREQVTETLDSKGGTKMVLSRTPVISIDAVSFLGSTVSSTTYEIDDIDAGILFKKTGWNATTLGVQAIERVPLNEGARDWSITYTAGYVMPDWHGTGTVNRTLPRDIERVCIDMVKWWQGSLKRDPNIIKEKVGEAEVTYANLGNSGDGDNLPPRISGMLKHWKRSDF